MLVALGFRQTVAFRLLVSSHHVVVAGLNASKDQRRPCITECLPCLPACFITCSQEPVDEVDQIIISK